MFYQYGRSDSIYKCRFPRSVTFSYCLSFNLNLILRVHANRNSGFSYYLAPLPMTTNTREVFMPVTLTLINCLSLRCLWILLSNPAWELGITVQAGNLVSEQSQATQSQCFHFSQMYPSLMLCLQISRGSLVSKAPTPPLSAYTLGLGPSENKAGSVTFKEFLLSAVHNLETRTHKGQGNILGISWR